MSLYAKQFPPGAILYILCIVSCMSLCQGIMVNFVENVISSDAATSLSGRGNPATNTLPPFHIKEHLCVCLRKVNWRTVITDKKFHNSKSSQIITRLTMKHHNDVSFSLSFSFYIFFSFFLFLPALFFCFNKPPIPVIFFLQFFALYNSISDNFIAFRNFNKINILYIYGYFLNFYAN